jgi:hypothetical protein
MLILKLRKKKRRKKQLVFNNALAVGTIVHLLQL